MNRIPLSEFHLNSLFKAFYSWGMLVKIILCILNLFETRLLNLLELRFISLSILEIGI